MTANTINLAAKDQAEAVVNTALSMLKTDQERGVLLRAIGTYSFIKLTGIEGNERAAMAAYCVGDHLVDPKMEKRRKTS